MRLIPLSVSYRLGTKDARRRERINIHRRWYIPGAAGLAWSYGWLFTAAHRPPPSLSSRPRWAFIVPIHGPSQAIATTPQDAHRSSNTSPARRYMKDSYAHSVRCAVCTKG